MPLALLYRTLSCSSSYYAVANGMLLNIWPVVPALKQQTLYSTCNLLPKVTVAGQHQILDGRGRWITSDLVPYCKGVPSFRTKKDISLGQQTGLVPSLLLRPLAFPLCPETVFPSPSPLPITHTTLNPQTLWGPDLCLVACPQPVHLLHSAPVGIPGLRLSGLGPPATPPIRRP